ncbi:MAG: MBOAT family O-acyltransferase, partial [Planctomycetota bacterium]
QGAPHCRRWLIAAVAGCLLPLLWFKYGTFVAGTWNAVAAAADLPQLGPFEAHLPVGISFYTFQAISYLVDVHRSHAVPQRRLARTALYIALFPQLIAGPIVRYATIAPQLGERPLRTARAASGIRRFLLGLARKALIADALAPTVDAIFTLPADHLNWSIIATGLLAFHLQIYHDFAGYSDMAIGLGRVFGFRIPENFDHPYGASSIREFWRRWHISLSTWFRDYLFVPLGGSRAGRARVAFNLLVVFVLCGLWHGASWLMVLWGLLHGAAVTAERLGLARLLARAPRAVGVCYTNLFLLGTWCVFRAPDAEASWRVTRAAAGWLGSAPAYAVWEHLTPAFVVVAGAGALTATRLPARGLERLRRGGVRAGAPEQLIMYTRDAMLLGLGIFAAAAVAAGTHRAFIYFRF